MEEKIRLFLERHRMIHADVASNIDNFCRQAKEGLEVSGAGCFEMIPSYIGASGEIPVNERVIVIDAGGTNLRVALAHFDETFSCIVEKMDVYPMPGTQGTITIETFYEMLAEYVAPYAALTRLIGFVFSFPCDITDQIDGRVIVFDKEVSISGSEGSLLGVGLNEALRRRGLSGEWQVVVMNDAISTLMGGMSEAKKTGGGNLLGIILGTGMNISYVQDCKGIVKDGAIRSREDAMCINMESGGYDGFIKSDFDVETQKRAELPGHMQFEKMVAGVYQGMVAEEMLKSAAVEGLFCNETAEGMLSLSGLTAVDMDCFVRDPSGDHVLGRAVKSAADRETVYALLDYFYERAAQLVAITLTGVLLLSLEGRDRQTKSCIVADGSTFYKTLLFRDKFYRYMEEIAAGMYGLSYFFTKVEDGNISGCAAAALMNRV